MKKLKLFFAACALILGVSNASGQADVTSTYLTNAGFDDCTAETSDVAAKIIKDYSSNGWTNANTGDFTTIAVTAYGGGKKVGDSTTPSTKKDGATVSGNTLGIIAGWGDEVKIQSTDITLPAGTYILLVDHYLSSSTLNYTPSSSRFGFVTSSTSYLVASTSFTASTWTTEVVSFTLAESTTGKIQIGLKGENKSGSGSPAVFYDDIRLLKAAEPIVSGTTDLYLYNEKVGQYLSGGMNWGTQAICDNYGQELTATVSEGKYTLKTQQYDNKYLGSDFYLDNGTGAKLFFLETAASSGKYYITKDGINYLTSNGAGAALLTNVTTPTDASVWTIVRKADRKTALSSATIDNPGNATFLIGDANFSRACLTTPWTMVADNQNLSGGEDGNGGIGNHCAESYHSTFTLSQTLSSMPVGVYGMTAQGFYRQDGSDNEHLPYFYIADQTGTFPLRTGSEGNMNAASASFTSGLYTIDPIFYRLDAAGDITLGAILETNTSLWCIFDNFQLQYYGDVTVAAVKMKASVDAYNAAMTTAQAFTEESMFADAWTTLQSAITANTVNLNDPALTEETLNTATANLVAANTAATAAVNVKTVYDSAVDLIGDKTNVDLTSLITNPGFETGNLNGWTSVDGGNVANNNNWSKVGTYYVERWTANGEETQSHLSDGTLTHDALVLPAGLYTITAKAQNQEQKNGVPGTGYFLYANDEKVEITGTNTYSTTVLLEEDKSELVIKFALEGCTGNWISCDDVHLTYVGEDFPAYTKATGKMDPAKSDAQDDAEATFLANKNVTNYNALVAAIADAEASVANYTKLKAAIDKAVAVKAANNFVTAAATTAFQNEIDDATSGWTGVTFTDAEAVAEINALGSAVSGWHAIDDGGKAGAFMASTWGKTQDNWWNDDFYINTWSTEGDNDGTGFSVPFFEMFVSDTNNLPLNTTKTATLSGLENGLYEVQIWARVQRRTNANFGDNKEITMSVNDGPSVSIMNGDLIAGYAENQAMRIGRFTARGMVTNGTLTLSIKTGSQGSNVHWLSWRDVTYTKVSDATVTITPANAKSTYVTTVPLDFTDVEGLDAYVATEAAAGTVRLEEVGAVPAGTPLMLIRTASTEYTVPVVASASAPAVNMFVAGDGTTKFDGSTYDYILYTDGLFYQIGSGTVATNKAYLHCTSDPTADGNTARGLRISFGDITGVANVEAASETEVKDGKFFKNGKLVIFKNGKKFNANGVQVK